MKVSIHHGSGCPCQLHEVFVYRRHIGRTGRVVQEGHTRARDCQYDQRGQQSIARRAEPHMGGVSDPRSCEGVRLGCDRRVHHVPLQKRWANSELRRLSRVRHSRRSRNKSWGHMDSQFANSPGKGTAQRSITPPAVRHPVAVLPRPEPNIRKTQKVPNAPIRWWRLFCRFSAARRELYFPGG